MDQTWLWAILRQIRETRLCDNLHLGLPKVSVDADLKVKVSHLLKLGVQVQVNDFF
jgi:hypothetical protein